MPRDSRIDRPGVPRNRHRDAPPAGIVRLRPETLAAIAAATVIALVTGVLAVVLGTDGEREKYVVESTAALDFMGADIRDGALIGGKYALAPAEAFSNENRAVRVGAVEADVAATASLPDVSAQDVVVSTAVVFPDAPTSRSSALVTARGSQSGDYRAGITVAAGRRAELSISRSGDSTEKLMWALLPFDVRAGDRVMIELRAVGAKTVMLRARAWIDSASAVVAEIVVDDASAARHSAPGDVGFAVVSDTALSAAGISVPSPAASILVDDFRAFALVPTTVPLTRGEASPVPSGDDSTGDLPREDAGAAAPGSARYAMPAGAIVVSPTGTPGAAGTIEAPLRTVAEAIERATPGGTIVLRAGSYHENVTTPEASHLTIQAAPGEEVWFDGSVVVDNWVKKEDAWLTPDWAATFDSSPTYTAGAPDGTEPGWQFVNAEYPMAAHPDQLWIDGQAQRQVGSVAEVVDGTFFVDYERRSIAIGSDPSGRVVRSSDLSRAIDLRSTDATLRGLGVRRYSPSVPQLGAVRAEAASARIENVSILDSATTGLFVKDPHTRIRHVTVARSGMLGIAVSYADDLVLNSVVAVANNTEGFNTSPVSGGAKITRSRSVRVIDSVFDSNAGHGLWFDESSYDGIATGNDISRNLAHGLIMEISSSFVIVNNVIAGNGQNGIKLNNTSNVEIWNNTLVGNGRTINIVQDGRRASDESAPGHDPRQPFPDPTMTWVISAVNVHNNVLAESTGKCLLCIEDYSKEHTAEELGVSANGNLYQRDDASTPAWAIVWSKGAEPDPAVFTSIDAFRSTTGQEQSGREIVGAAAVSSAGELADSVRSIESSIAVPLPDAIANIASATADAAGLGAWRAPAPRRGG